MFTARNPNHCYVSIAKFSLGQRTKIDLLQVMTGVWKKKTIFLQIPKISNVKKYLDNLLG